ncbi:MAG TPA: HAD-IIIA family hydrolase [Rhodanobacteraceae bacterium]|nr:HAD-IIIA family hydrolase [Rhodanobacteraceae bacterium]
MSSSIRHVILDRDGVLNAEPRDGGYVVDWAQWRWLPGALESLALLGSKGVRISVATNQSCVGRGIVSREQIDVVHARMLDEAAQAGATIGHVFVCPHAPEQGCDCRKPAPGLLLQALDATGSARNATVVLGDDFRDLQAAESAGIAAVLVRTGKGSLAEAAVAGTGVPIFDDIRAFTSALLSHSVSLARSGTP